MTPTVLSISERMLPEKKMQCTAFSHLRMLYVYVSVIYEPGVAQGQTSWWVVKFQYSGNIQYFQEASNWRGCHEEEIEIYYKGYKYTGWLDKYCRHKLHHAQKVAIEVLYEADGLLACQPVQSHSHLTHPLPQSSYRRRLSVKCKLYTKLWS